MTALDRFAECCRYVDFKRELIREKTVTYIKGAAYKRIPLLGKDTVTQIPKSRQCYLPFPKQKSCVRWPQYMEDEPNRAEIET